jgi:hypothetical protein
LPEPGEFGVAHEWLPRDLFCLGQDFLNRQSGISSFTLPPFGLAGFRQAASISGSCDAAFDPLVIVSGKDRAGEKDGVVSLGTLAEACHHLIGYLLRLNGDQALLPLLRETSR